VAAAEGDHAAVNVPAVNRGPAILSGGDSDVVEGFLGDPLGAVEYGLHSCAPDQMGQAPDHPIGAFVQVGVEPDEAARDMAVQPQCLFQGGDE